MEKSSKIYIAGHTGMVGSALVRKFKQDGYSNLLLRTRLELDLINQVTVFDFLKQEKPDYIIIAAAKVGGIAANDTFRAQFIYENLTIAANLIHGAHQADIDNVLFLGSSCIYPRDCHQPMKEEYLLTGLLEQTNEPYAIAKIAGIKLCENYYRQYNRNYFSVMPTNLYGPNDNYNFETSHVLPAILRKMYLAHLLEEGHFDRIRHNLELYPFSINTKYNPSWSNEDIVALLDKYGIDINQRKHREIPQSIAASPSTPSKIRVNIWGSGTPRREFLHVHDLADACFYLLQNTNAEKIYAQGVSHINIGTGSDVTIRELAEMIKQIVGFKGEILWNQSRPDGTMQKLMENERIGKLGWGYSIELYNGISMLKKDMDLREG